jgi:hypothetical protein
MRKSITVKPKRGRPPSGGRDPFVGIRLPASQLEQIGIWSEKHEAATRSEAIRRLVDLGLTVKTKGHQSKEGQKKRAREMAGSAIDDMTDTAASPDDQASRKRRLLKGPEEFRNVRVDRLRKA